MLSKSNCLRIMLYRYLTIYVYIYIYIIYILYICIYIIYNIYKYTYILYEYLWTPLSSPSNNISNKFIVNSPLTPKWCSVNHSSYYIESVVSKPLISINFCAYLTNISTPVSSILRLIPFQDCFREKTCFWDSPMSSKWAWAILENSHVPLFESFVPFASRTALSLTAPVLLCRQPMSTLTSEN